ncbi:tRNA delta(2)-isopentenylpyrophosphate transferase [Mycoplasmoides gallisepticum CA06_2006.052-5-2P]|uniref:tRNA dimethylallyltransferase n=1 Tax=Mycoplasmoides gallisepticum WI01_2001.043-13-2P TaxID=1159201 RepID=J3YGP8_MYCGL|nr:isopentenyl transferase family protein [Mycoplasmoides gallisepticum]AFP75798.1 tRNA delta(2)-isopentenylpyrophosphate transferase [Mycoplasmoides gallisepticum VA94_7994-1-7P]AFP76565.1 tRNA delta(2)-isopentenylpyrophosphate transferase [Mycoplasmoides gallisepticum NC95_13295-2-2P]AFP77319.1 tRNA delta(2)-isopentenylpyrophosphate transferase [Mycoplasmoides gallisepticum NC96_1596-4-2P]AFP78090.1 tRNA delta(2)-isopentenylpyrophosphate transferase [Mycoplasmoides gallisepticum NY01_2001.047
MIYSKRLILVVGPTGTKKSYLANMLAKKLNVPIISADAYQVYKELNAGVNKPSEKTLSEIKYHFISNISIFDEWSIAHFNKRAKEILEQAPDWTIVCGGSHLYVNSLINDYQLEKQELDTDLFDALDKLDNQEIFNQLCEYDFQEAIKIGKNNRKRLLRALYLFKKYGKKAKNDSKKFDYVVVKCMSDKEKLFPYLSKRLDEMIHDLNWTKEIEYLDKIITDKKLDKELIAMKALGYKEIYDAWKNNQPIDKEMINKKLKRLVKHQLTWTRNKFNDGMKQFAFNFFEDDAKKTCDEIIQYIKSSHD